jgi:hypothetical protein
MYVDWLKTSQTMKWLAFLHLTISFVTPFGLYYNSFWYNY